MLRTTLLTFALAVVAAFAQPALARSVGRDGLLRGLDGVEAAIVTAPAAPPTHAAAASR